MSADIRGRGESRAGNQQLALLVAAGLAICALIALPLSFARRTTADYGETLQRNVAIHELRRELDGATASLERYVRTGDSSQLGELLQQRPRVDSAARALSGYHFPDTASRIQMRAIQAGLTAWRDASAQAVAARQAQAADFYLRLSYAQRVQGYTDSYLQALLQLQLDRGRADLSDTQTRQTGLRVAVLLGMLATLAALGVFARRFLRLQQFRTAGLLRESQLVALQSQMNPHLLFNTLNSISRTASAEHAGRTGDLIRRLANVLRYVLHHPGRTVALSEELQVVHDYLELQRVRFGTRLRAKITCDAGVAGLAIPPLSVQPLVENAIVHGIEPVEGGGTVTIRCELDDGARADRSVLSIRVEDDGVGIPDHAVDQVRDGLRNPGVSDGDYPIGLRNVASRLRLRYGDAMRLEIRRRPGGGTVALLRVPAIPVEAGNDGAITELPHPHLSQAGEQTEHPHAVHAAHR